MTTARMANPVNALDGALTPLLALSKVIATAQLDEVLLELIHLRASQINECGVCVDLAGAGLARLAVPPEKIIAVAAYRDSVHFSTEERAVLAVTEQLTRQSHATGGVSDDAFERLADLFTDREMAAILLNIGLVNLWNRINDATRQVPGSW